MIIREALIWADRKLKNKSKSPQLDAEVLLNFSLNKDRAWLFANQNIKLTTSQIAKFKKLIQLRANHWPVAYLTGHKEFFGLDFQVNPNVLIPRPETETLVEQAINLIKKNGITKVIDVGTGSGCIIISLAKNSKKGIKFYATDISAKALKVARANARRHKVKIKFMKADLLPKRLDLDNSLILANLPYLTPKQMKNPDLKHEPRLALIAGKDGLKYYRELFKKIQNISNVELLLEYDKSQETTIKKLTHLQK